MYTLPLFMSKVLSEEKHLMKSMGILQLGISWVEIFRGRFSREEFDEWEFSGAGVLEGNFLKTVFGQSALLMNVMYIVFL